MKKEHWTKVESLIEGLNSEIEDLNDALVEINQFKVSVKVLHCVQEMRVVANNLSDYSNGIYCECENDRADTADDKLEGYEDVVRLLPNASKLSVAEVDALVEHIKTWRKEFGYPEV